MGEGSTEEKPKGREAVLTSRRLPQAMLGLTILFNESERLWNVTELQIG